MGKPSQNYGF